MQIGDAEEATEAAQETFVRAYFALRTCESPRRSSLGLWELRIAWPRRPIGLRSVVGRSPGSKPIRLNRPASRRQCADTAVTEAVARLPDTYREVIVLRFYEGQSCQQISRGLDVPLGTVTKRLSRAYGLLRERLGAAARDRESEVSR